MKGIKSLKVGLAGLGAGALLLAGSLLVVGQVFAASGTLTVTDATAAPGDQATVDLVANVEDPGLGAWTVDISFDTSVLSVVSCDGGVGVCNDEFADGVVRITGASAGGIEGEETLGSVTFACEDEGSSDVEIATEVFADATIGDPQPIDAELHDGHVECAEETAEPVATSTPLPGPPTTGQGGSTSTDYSWLIAGLSLVGVVALAGYSLLRVRR